jgi:hypothetical protein
MFCKKSLSFFLILIFLIPLFLFSKDIFAISPFLRQEVHDNTNDVYDLRTCDFNSKICDTAKDTTDIQSIDIKGVSYVSDGRFLNTSIWLTKFPTINHSSGYIIFIDIDSNTETGGDDGADYMIQVSFNSTLKKWEKIFVERSNFVKPKPISDIGLITTKILKNSSITNPLHINIDLKDLNFPKFFDMVFYTTTASQFEDHTSWIHIPPPEIQLSFSENPLNIRPEETKTVYLEINSTTGLEPIIQFLTENTTSKIEWKFLDKNMNIKLPSYGFTTIPIEIYAKNVTAGEQLFFPISSSSYFPFKSFRPEFKDTNDSLIKPFVDTVDRTNLAINILNPIEPHEHVKKFIENWFNPLTGIYQTASGIIGGIGGYILARYKNKNSNNETIKKE